MREGLASGKEPTPKQIVEGISTLHSNTVILAK